MKKQTYSQLTLSVFCMALAAFLTAAPASGQGADETLQFAGQEERTAHVQRIGVAIGVRESALHRC